MGRLTSFTIALLAASAVYALPVSADTSVSNSLPTATKASVSSNLPSCAAPAANNSPVQVQKITWVQPTAPIQVAEPVDPAPTSVRQQGTKASYPAKPVKTQATAQADPVTITTTEPALAAPLHPDKQPLTKLVSAYYGLSEDVVKRALAYYGPCDDALVALFMTNASNSKLAQIITLRQDNSWKDVISFLQLDTKYLFKNIQLGPVPKESMRNCMSYVQYMNWREEPEYRDLGDLSVREMVGASLLHNRFNVGSLEALRQVHACGGAMAALKQYTAFE